MKLVALGIAVVGAGTLAGCKHGDKWGTFDGEDGMMLVREYRPVDAANSAPPSWVLRLDLSPAHPGSYNQRWVDDSLDLQLGTANGAVDGKLTCSATADAFTCDGHAFDAKAGRVITYAVDALGQIGSPKQTELAAYKSFH